MRAGSYLMHMHGLRSLNAAMHDLENVPRTCLLQVVKYASRQEGRSTSML
jgi:hypothetical protein